MRILIVDDDQDAQFVIKHTLSAYGECITADDGVQALERFKEAWEAESPFDLICLDIMMPNMNGLETLEAIRKLEEEMSIGGIEGVKIVMLTALEGEEPVSDSLRSGCDGFVHKQAGPRKFRKQLETLGFMPTPKAE